MTEAEARKKWCPFVRVTYMRLDGETEKPMPPSCNRLVDYEGEEMPLAVGTNCVASDCMMWREAIGADSKGRPRPYGYCGLAGER